MVTDLNLTREFFDKQETDDTLQRIREQYLASKKNLHALMMKQNEEAHNNNYSPIGNERIRNEPATMRSPESVGGGARAAEAAAVVAPTADNIILMNEVRSLKRMAFEQQSQIRKLTSDLQLQKNTTFELQNKILTLQSHVTFLENSLLSYWDSMSQFPTNPVTATSTSSHLSNPRNFSPASYSPSIEENTTRLIQMSRPK